MHAKDAQNSRAFAIKNARLPRTHKIKMPAVEFRYKSLGRHATTYFPPQPRFCMNQLIPDTFSETGPKTGRETCFQKGGLNTSRNRTSVKSQWVNWPPSARPKLQKPCLKHTRSINRVVHSNAQGQVYEVPVRSKTGVAN